MKQIKIILKEESLILKVRKEFEEELKKHEICRKKQIDIMVRANYFKKEDFIGFEFLEENQHFCQYCGNVVDGKNEKILCNDCQMFFGHNYNNEL